jgi:hypothetical protein
MGVDEVVQPVIQGGALAVLAMVLLYGLKVALPTMVQTMMESNVSVQAALTKQQRIMAKMTAVILLHDATVKGKNPDTIGSTEDIVERIMNEE